MANAKSETFSNFFRIFTILSSILAIIFLVMIGRYILSLPFFALIVGALKKKALNIFNIIYLYNLFFSKKAKNFNKFNSGNSKSSMNLDEAYETLGIAKNCSRKDIIEAHKKLIIKLHPDKSGNNYLAGKINQARDLLLSIHK